MYTQILTELVIITLKHLMIMIAFTITPFTQTLFIVLVLLPTCCRKTTSVHVS